MPLVGSTKSPVKVTNVGEYSHSTVFTISMSKFKAENVPPLLTRWTQPSFCHDRWMLADNRPEVVATRRDWIVFDQTKPPIASTENSSSKSDQSLNSVASTIWTESATPSLFHFTAWSMYMDPLFTSCQPYKDQPMYSPGICPQGQEIVEVTEIHIPQSKKSIQTVWYASCCSSGMTFGSDVSRFCLSTIDTPISVHALLNISYDTSKWTTKYEWNTYADGTSTTVSNMTLLKTGLAVADPVEVAWELDDMISFPSSYRTSLANKIGVTLPSSASPAGTSSLPSQTGDGASIPSSQHRLNPGSIAGIVVGVLAGTAILIGVVVGLLWRRRKRVQSPPSGGDDTMPEMEDQDAANSHKRWFLGGRWRSEVEVEPASPQELESKTVRVVPGPPVELDSSEVGTRQE